MSRRSYSVKRVIFRTTIIAVQVSKGVRNHGRLWMMALLERDLGLWNEGVPALDFPVQTIAQIQNPSMGH